MNDIRKLMETLNQIEESAETPEQHKLLSVLEKYFINEDDRWVLDDHYKARYCHAGRSHLTDPFAKKFSVETISGPNANGLYAIGDIEVSAKELLGGLSLTKIQTKG